MIEFYVEKVANETGAHLVHSSKCALLPATDRMRYLGVYSNLKSPVNDASTWFPNVTTCLKCLPA